MKRCFSHWVASLLMVLVLSFGAIATPTHAAQLTASSSEAIATPTQDHLDSAKDLFSKENQPLKPTFNLPGTPQLNLSRFDQVSKEINQSVQRDQPVPQNLNLRIVKKSGNS